MKNKNIVYIILVLVILFAGFIYFASKREVGFQSAVIDPKTAISQVKSGAKLIDVRTPEEYKEGYVDGAVNINWENQNEFAQAVSSLPKNDTYILYCKSGNRSQQALDYMKSNGFTNVYSVEDGILSGELPLIKSSLNTTEKTLAIQGSKTASPKDALDKALMDEYKAKATYEKVLEKYPGAKPFSNIVNAEQNHINSLLSLYTTYDIAAPSYINTLPAYTGSLAEACQTGVKAEIANVKLYTDELLPKVKDYSDVTNVFNNLYSASQNNHLPAFQRCS